MTLSAIFLNNARGPFWLGSNLDPEYVYLLNAANLASFKGVGHIDHPGTPVQAIGAITIRVVHFFQFSSHTHWYTDVLKRPEYYLKAINTLFVTLNGLMLLILGFVTYKVTRDILLSLWLQLALFFSITLLQFGLTRVTPEPLLLLSSQAIVVMIVLFMASANAKTSAEIRAKTGAKTGTETGTVTGSDAGTTANPNGKKQFLILLLFGLITGFGIANKITFIPMAVIPLILFPRLKNKFYYLAAAAVGFVIFTLPIIRMYPRFFQWLRDLLTHTGQYGSGASQLISSQKYLENIKQLLTGNPFFSLVLILSLMVIAAALLIPGWRKFRRDAPVNAPVRLYFKILLAVTAAQAAGLLMVSKHSANHYLLPVLTLTGIALMLIFLYMRQVLTLYPQAAKIAPTVMIIIVIALTVLINPFVRIKNKGAQLTKLKEYSLSIHKEVIDNYPDSVKIYYYRSSSPEYALKFGNDLSRSYHSAALEKIYKDVYFYDIWTQRFTGFDYDRAIPFEAIRSKYGAKIVFQGSRGIKVPGLRLEKVSQKPFYEGIYTASGGQGLFLKKPPLHPAKTFVK